MKHRMKSLEKMSSTPSDCRLQETERTRSVNQSRVENSSEQRNQSLEDAGQKRSRPVTSEEIPEDKSLVNVLYICKVNNCGYNCEYSNKQSDQIRSQQLFTVAETLTCDNIICSFTQIRRAFSCNTPIYFFTIVNNLYCSLIVVVVVSLGDTTGKHVARMAEVMNA
jgi:hypothetical protein